MRTNVNTIGQGRTLVVALMAVCVGMLAMAAPVGGQTTEPAPITAIPATPATPPAATPPLPATEFSDQETVLLDAITDGNDELLTTPLSILLKHAAQLPDGDIKAEKIDLNALWVAPQKYREKLKPVAFEGRYVGLCETKGGAAREWWPAGTFYLMHISVTPDRPGKEMPIVLVALTKAPPESLVKGAKVYFTGYFYKNALLPLQLNEAEKRINPVLVAKAVEVAELEPVTARRGFNSWGIVAAIVVLLGMGIYFQMRVRAQKQQAAMHQRVQALTHQPEEDADFDVDPQLAQEVERFEAEQEATHQPKDSK